ncbi:MAG: hypothetical protein V1913_16595 [Fibrobacterota bacterium]
MNLKEWRRNGWLKPHVTSLEEIGNLFEIVRRDLEDAGREEISTDWRFGIAYNAALKLCTILLYAEGFRPEKTLAHYRTLQALPVILGMDREDDAAYLDACRIKRNSVEYDCAGGTTAAEADELLKFTKELEKAVKQWLKKHHQKLF